MFYAWAAGEFLFGSPSELKEVGAEPDLFYVGLVAALGNYLLYCVLLLAFFVFSQPDQTESSPPEQLHLVETVREAVSKGIALFLAEVIRVLPFLFPFQVDLLKRIIVLSCIDLMLRVTLVVPCSERGMLGSDFVSEELFLLP